MLPILKKSLSRNSVNYSFPNINILFVILSTNNRRPIRNTAKCVYYAMQLRKDRITDTAAS